MTEGIWSSQLFENYRNAKRSGPRPKTRFRDQLHVLLLDLYVAWRTDPELSIGIKMRTGDWRTNDRYNALHLSPILPVFVHLLASQEYIEISKGSYSGPHARGNRTTRIRAADRLIALFLSHEVPLVALGKNHNQEMIILRDDQKNETPYEDTDKTNMWRGHMQRYNELLWSTFIDLPALDVPYIDRPITEGPRRGQINRVAVSGNDYVVRRVFSRSDWECNGRLYGGWWQHIPKVFRKQIHINDNPTVEIDFKGLHIAILSKQKGVPLEGDPYALDDLAFPEEINDQHGLIKQLVLTAINASSQAATYGAFRIHYPLGHPAKNLTNAQLEHALQVFVAKHPHLEDTLCSDQGIHLMKIDSEIAFSTIARFYQVGIPVLSVHDSFIMEQEYADQVRAFMDEATTYYLGAPFATETIQGETFYDPLYHGELAPDERQRSRGYLARQTAFRHRDDWKRDEY